MGSYLPMLAQEASHALLVQVLTGLDGAGERRGGQMDGVGWDWGTGHKVGYGQGMERGRSRRRGAGEEGRDGPRRAREKRVRANGTGTGGTRFKRVRRTMLRFKHKKGQGTRGTRLILKNSDLDSLF